MALKSPFENLAGRPRPREMVVDLPNLGSVRLRELDPVARMAAGDAADALTLKYVRGVGGKNPLPMALPTSPPTRVKMSERLCNLVAMLMAMEVPEQGSDKTPLANWLTLIQFWPDDYRVLSAAYLELMGFGDDEEPALGNSGTAEDEATTPPSPPSETAGT